MGQGVLLYVSECHHLQRIIDAGGTLQLYILQFAMPAYVRSSQARAP